MNRFVLLFLLLLAGCTVLQNKIETVRKNVKELVEQEYFEKLNQVYQMRYAQFNLSFSKETISSCEQFKDFRYDVFFSEENQKCLSSSLSLNEITSKLSQINISTATTEQLSENLDMVQSIGNCLGGANLRLENIKNSQQYEYIKEISLYCTDRENPFKQSVTVQRRVNHDRDGLDKDKVDQLMNYYSFFADSDSYYSKIKQELINRQAKEENEKKKAEKLEAFLQETNKHPVFIQIKKKAPEFLRAKLKSSGCPFAYLINNLKDFSVLSSDFIYIDEYKVIKTGANSLKLSVRDSAIEFIIKDGYVSVPLIKMDWEVDKSMLNNDITAAIVCQGELGLLSGF